MTVRRRVLMELPWKRLLPLVALWLGIISLPAKEFRAGSAAELKRLAPELTAGDRLVVATGSYDVGMVTVTNEGRADAPIRIAAEKVGGAVLTGRSGFVFEKAAWVELQGFTFATTDAPPVRILGSHHVRISRNTLRVTETGPATGGKHLNWVQISGSSDRKVNSHDNRIDHNLLEGKRTIGQVVAINGLDAPVFASSQHDRIDHNYFRRVGPRIPNGMEAIRAGLSQLSLSPGYTVIEDNVFEECDGDPEVISVKNCFSTVRHNTFIRCQGGVCLRHGNGSEVAGNFFFGENKRDTHGVRVYGDDHKVYNNYFQELSGPVLELAGGDQDYPAAPDPARDGEILKSHVRPRNIVVVFNTFVNNGSPIALGASGSGGTKLAPQKVVLANNLVQGARGEVFVRPGKVEGLTLLGNVMLPGSGAALGWECSPEQIRVADPGLGRRSELWRLAPGSPAVGAARGEFDFVRMDAFGNPRSKPTDVGAEQLSAGKDATLPPSASGVGPLAPGD